MIIIVMVIITINNFYKKKGLDYRCNNKGLDWKI